MPVPVRFALMGLGIALFVVTFLAPNSVARAFKLRDDPNAGISLQRDALAFVGRVLGLFCLIMGLLSWVAAPAARP
ncbi:MAG: hypothetical protein ACLPYS_14890 [Vulcanimicrobiaceae bacterium]